MKKWVGGWGVVCHISMVLESGISLELVFMVFVFRIYGLVSYVFFVIIAKFWVLKCWLWLMDWVNLVSSLAIWLVSCVRLILSLMIILILSGRWPWWTEKLRSQHPQLHKKYVIHDIFRWFFGPFSFSSYILPHPFSNSLRLKLRLIIKKPSKSN